VPSKSVAAASEPNVAQAAREALARGNAVDAVLAGVLMAAAEHPGVLLGPLQMLVGGAGAGLRAIDGRVRQPGSGVPRPRGLNPGEPMPPAASVGVPALPASVALVLASLGSSPMMRVAAAAIERARGLSPERASVIESFARRGSSAFVDDPVLGELTAVAGRSVRGSLTKRDLASVRPTLVSHDEKRLGPRGLLMAPWRVARPMDASFVEVVAAADARGLMAIACYEAPPDGLAVPALGLIAPASASPVMRGESRVRPGEPRPAAAPIALRVQKGIVDLAIGLAKAGDADVLLDAVLENLAVAPIIVEAFAAASHGIRVVVQAPSG
jgi:hypothetical protein